MFTMPSLIEVAVTPRNEAVSAAGAPEVAVAPDVAVGAGTAVVGAAAFFAPPPPAASWDPTPTRPATSGTPRKRPIISPLAPGLRRHCVQGSDKGGPALARP